MFPQVSLSISLVKSSAGQHIVKLRESGRRKDKIRDRMERLQQVSDKSQDKLCVQVWRFVLFTLRICCDVSCATVVCKSEANSVIQDNHTQ